MSATHRGVGGWVVNGSDRRFFPVARFFQPQRRDRAVELALEKPDLLVVGERREHDVLEPPIVIGFTNAGGSLPLGNLGLNIYGKVSAGYAGLFDGRLEGRTRLLERDFPSTAEVAHLQVALLPL